MFAGLLRGVAAGAAGTTALNAVTYLDMAWRGRPPSTAPQRAVEELASRTGRPVPGTGEERDNRLDGLGALSGIATGVAVGAAAGMVRALVLRLGPVLGPLLLGAAAMTATDASLTRLGLTDPQQWDATAWASDAAPHLAFGMGCYATLRATTRR